MKGMTIIVLLIYSFFIQHSASIDLILPLSESDAANFEIKKHFLLENQGGNLYDYNFTYYESLTSDIIRRLVFHGVEFFNDTSEHEPGFRRFVLYSVFSDRVTIGIGKHESGVLDYEETFEITERMIRNLTQSPELIETFIRERSDSPMGTFLNSIFTKNNESNRTDYGDIDSVDDEPKLLRGNRDISAEEIEKEVDAIIQSNSSTVDDPSLPGHSGLAKFSNLRISEKKDEKPEEDRDSD